VIANSSELLVAIPAVGLALSAPLMLATARTRLAALAALALAALAGFVPFALLGHSEDATGAVRALWQWSSVGGAAVQASYQVDALALTATAVVVLVSAASAHIAAREGRPLLTGLVLVQGLACLALVSVTDLVVAVLVAAVVAVVTGAVGLLVMPQAAVARLVALLAFGVQALVAAALLVNRFGGNTFDLDRIPPAAITPGVLAAMALAGALFCGLYPLVPWRYETRHRGLSGLRGALAFPAGLAATVLTFRVLAATDAPTVTLLLPQLDDITRAALSVLVIAVAAATLRRPTREGLHRAAGALAIVALLLVYPFLLWSHIVALAALLTVAYAAVASAAIPEEWSVARFDARLGALWAAAALGTPLAIGGALFAMVAGGVALVVESAPVPPRWGIHARTAARVLVTVGPFTAAAGALGSGDLATAIVAGAALLWAGALELGHALRATREDGWMPPNQRWFAALSAYAIFLCVALASGETIARASVELGRGDLDEWHPLVIPAIATLSALVAMTITLLPEIITIRLPDVAASFLRRVLVTADPVPGALLFYRLLEHLSSRVASAFTLFEERGGVWLATLLIGLTLIWAAST
jgi:hypothetical protein